MNEYWGPEVAIEKRKLTSKLGEKWVEKKFFFLIQFCTYNSLSRTPSLFSRVFTLLLGTMVDTRETSIVRLCGDRVGQVEGVLEKNSTDRTAFPLQYTIYVYYTYTKIEKGDWENGRYTVLKARNNVRIFFFIYLFIFLFIKSSWDVKSIPPHFFQTSSFISIMRFWLEQSIFFFFCFGFVRPWERNVYYLFPSQILSGLPTCIKTHWPTWSIPSHKIYSNDLFFFLICFCSIIHLFIYLFIFSLSF